MSAERCPAPDECPEPHCTARAHCTRHVEPTELTCPTCLSKTRADLAQIVATHAAMSEEAQHQGVESEAANLAGPEADPHGWEARRVWLARTTGRYLGQIGDNDPDGPLTVLGGYDMRLREEYGLRTTLRTTVPRSAAFLDRILHRLANDPDQDFPLFVSEVAACRAHMEAVLHDSRQPETGAPCPACTDETGSGPALVKHYDDDDVTGASDRWECPACRQRWKEADYRLRIGARYLDHADALTASQIRTQYRVPEGTVRRWASGNKPCVKVRGKDDRGRQLYDVADVLAARESETQRA